MRMFPGWPFFHARLILLGIIVLAGCRREEDVPAAKYSWSGSAREECPSTQGAAETVELADLAALPTAYEGKFIRVEGYYYDYFEHAALHPEPEAEIYSGNFDEQVWVSNIDAEYSRQRVQLTGIFTAKSQGHGGQWPGTLCVVSVLKLPGTAG